MSLFELDGMGGAVKGLLQAAKVLLYICGIYLMVTGALAFLVRKKANRCCNFCYALVLPPAFILMLISAIPILMVNSVDMSSIDKICAAAAAEGDRADKPKPAARLLADDDMSMKDKAKAKWTDMKDSGMNESQQKAYKFIGPVIKDMDNSIGVASGIVMCKSKCPCAPIDAAALASYPAEFATAYATWSTSTGVDAWKFDGTIKNFNECMVKLETMTPKEKMDACVAKYNTGEPVKKAKSSSKTD